MSFWSKLFGGGGSGSGSSTSGKSTDAGPAEDYKGYSITPVNMPVGSEFQLAGRIEKEIGGAMRRYDFVRADRFSSKTEAAQLAVSKGRQIIDEQGERMFPPVAPTGQA